MNNYPKEFQDANGAFLEPQFPQFVPILPASSNCPRNLSGEEFIKPPPFMPTVKEMRGRLNLDCFGVEEDIDSVSSSFFKSWKAENKRIYGSKVVSYVLYSKPRLFLVWLENHFLI